MIPKRGLSILCAAAALAIVMNATAGAQLVPNFDHLKCYKVKDFAPKKIYKVDLLPEQRPPFNFEQGCKLVVPAKLFCIDVIKQGVVPNPPGAPPGQKAGDYLCYKIVCPKQTLPTLVASDQFGTRDLLIKPPKYLCAPATKQIQHTTPTPTPPPLPTETPTVMRTPGCDFDTTTGKCGGPCPLSTAGNPQQCVFIVDSNGTAGCDCREPDPACHQPTVAGAVCTGPCPDPRDQCRDGRPGEPPCMCSHPCSQDPSNPAVPPSCSGDCTDPTEVCALNAAGVCDCHPPIAVPCGSATAPQCDGGCPNTGEACVPGATGCFCETGTPPACGVLQGPPQCLGVCPVNQACVVTGPVPGGSCTCQ